MRNTIRSLFCAVLAVAAIGFHQGAMAQSAEEARLLTAAEVLDTLRGQRDQRIPEHLMDRAYGVAVIPSVKKAAFVIGARRGSGVLSVRDSRGRFGSPVFINLTGGSIGWQFGAQETDIVLVFTTRRGVDGIAGGKLTLGAGASVAAGPVGRQAEAAAGTDAEVYAYSRARGLFIGVALDGTGITIDDRSNRSFYGKRDVLPSEIMNGTVSSDSENVRRFLAAVARATGESAGAGAAAGSQSAPPVTVPQGTGQDAPVQTFPLEDPAPGQEPL